MTTIKNMTRGEAETILGMKGAYVYKDVIKAYRIKVKTCHPDAGGSTDDMIAVNAAKSYMDDLFANNKNAVYNCVTASEKAAEAAASADAAAAAAAAAKAAADPGFVDAMNAAYNRANRAERGERVRAAYKAKHGTGVGKNSTKSAKAATTTDTAKDSTDAAWWETAYGAGAAADEVTVDAANAPGWFKVADWFVNKFPWRVALLMFAIAWYFIYAYASNIPMTPGMTLFTLLFVGAGMLNLVTGCFTTPLRKALRTLIDAAARASG